MVDARQLLSLPLVGDALRRRVAELPRARRGVNAPGSEDDELFLQARPISDSLITPDVYVCMCLHVGSSHITRNSFQVHVLQVSGEAWSTVHAFCGQGLQLAISCVYSA